MMQEFRYVILQLCRQTIKVCVIDILNYVKLLPSPLMRPATQNAAWIRPSRAWLRYAEAEAPLYSTTTPFWSITFA